MSKNTVVKGIDRIILFRVLAEEGEQVEAGKLAFQTEHDVDKSRDSDSTPTKDGHIQSVGELEVEISVSSLLSRGDATAERLEQAFEDGDTIELWDIDRGAPTDGDKYPSTYYQALMSSFNQSTNSEDDLEMEMEFAVNGKGVKGDATLTSEQADVVQYAFKDTTAAIDMY